MVQVKLPDGSITFTVTWQFNGEYCLDCGLPAAFYAYRYGRKPSPPDALCAICAANSAADDGAIIVRMFEEL